MSLVKSLNGAGRIRLKERRLFGLAYAVIVNRAEKSQTSYSSSLELVA
ncbi:hypothetical protein [Photobacterium sp. DNB22_13_2]